MFLGITTMIYVHVGCLNVSSLLQNLNQKAELCKSSTVLARCGVGTELDLNSTPERFFTVGKHSNTLIGVFAVFRVPLKKPCVRTSITGRAWRTFSLVSHQYHFRAFWKVCNAG